MLATLFVVTMALPAVTLTGSAKQSDPCPGCGPMGQGWPMFHHDQAHTGVTNCIQAPVTNHLLWSYEAGGSVLSSPAVSNGRVYCASYEDSTVFCLNESSGAFVWKFSASDWIPYSSPAISGDKVYIGSRDKNVYCLNASTGEKLWSFTTGGMIYSSPTIVKNRLYIGSSDNKLYCLNATSGNPLWNYSTTSFVWCSPAVADNKVYVGSMDAKMYCLNATSGEPLWNFTTGMIIYSSPVIEHHRVYFGSWDHSVYCLDADNGTKIWSRDIGSGSLGAIFSTPAVLDGRVYIGVDWMPQGGFFCLNASDGTILWNRTLNGAVYASPAIADHKVYVGTCQDHAFYCFDTQNGTQLWSYTGGDYFASSPAIANGKVFVGSNDHHLYCFAPAYQICQVRGGLLKTTAWVKNNGPDNLTVNYTISLTGGFILLGKTTSGAISIRPYSVGSIRSQAIVGFGRPTITYTVGNVTATAKAHVFLFYVDVHQKG